MCAKLEGSLPGRCNAFAFVGKTGNKDYRKDDNCILAFVALFKTDLRDNQGEEVYVKLNEE